ncbi:hypothetical protein VRB03_00300 [Erwinia aphidicola]
MTLPLPAGASGAVKWSVINDQGVRAAVSRPQLSDLSDLTRRAGGTCAPYSFHRGPAGSVLHLRRCRTGSIILTPRCSVARRKTRICRCSNRVCSSLAPTGWTFCLTANRLTVRTSRCDW